MGGKYTESQKNATDKWVKNNREKYNEYKRPYNFERYQRNKVKYCGQKRIKTEFMRLSNIFTAFLSSS